MVCIMVLRGRIRAVRGVPSSRGRGRQSQLEQLSQVAALTQLSWQQPPPRDTTRSRPCLSFSSFEEESQARYKNFKCKKISKSAGPLLTHRLMPLLQTLPCL